MQLALRLSFSMLLASIVFTLTLFNIVAASPLRRDAGITTLPLKRITQTRSDIHPQLQFQLHVNRGIRRIARMKKRQEPTDDELVQNLLKRYVILPPESTQHDKRYNRHGIPTIDKSDAVTPENQVKANNNLEATGSPANGSYASVKQGSGYHTTATGTATGNTTSSSTTSSAAAASGTGISTLDIQAAQNGGLTQASNPTANNSLGLAIEYVFQNSSNLETAILTYNSSRANDVGYIASVQIGTPPRNFNMLADSGSADFWVGSENCTSQAGGGCGNHTFLGPQSSSTFVDTGVTFQVSYGTGNVAGDKVTDNVQIAGLSLNSHQFGVATSESKEFSGNQVPFDGILGLAQSKLAQQGVLTPVESLAQAGAIASAITSYKLGRIADGANNNNGEITFGGLDSTKFNQATLVTFNNVNQNGFWEGAVDSFTVNGQDSGLKGRTAVLDTGTTLIIAPPSDAQAIHAMIPGAQPDGQGGFTIPCTTSAVVALTFSGKTFNIDSRDLLFLPVDPNNPTGACISGISSGQFGAATEWLVGDVFLKNVYFSTDVGNNAVSLASLA